MLDDHGPGYAMPGVAHQVFEKPEFAGQHIDQFAATFDRPGQQVELEIGHPQPGLRRRPGAAAQQGFEPGEQLTKGERLDQIIVATSTQPLYPIIDTAEGRNSAAKALADLWFYSNPIWIMPETALSASVRRVR